MRLLLNILLCLTLMAPARAAMPIAAEPLLARLHFRTGLVALPGGVATLTVPAGFRYLDPTDTHTLVVDGWGNPPGAPTLGMLLPAAVDPLGMAGWGVIVSYERQGHVGDAAAGRIDYPALLAQLQESVDDHNAARREQGYPAMTLIGWAEPPRYDPARHALHWAKVLHTEGSNENGLNYDIRLLGREGVLVLNAVAGMDQLDQIRKELDDVAAGVAFAPGQRYADFNSKTDQLAKQGLAALGSGAGRLDALGKLGAQPAAKAALLLALAAFGSWRCLAYLRRKATVN